MVCRIKREKDTGAILEVLTPTGVASKVYPSLVNQYKDEEYAATIYLATGTNNYRQTLVAEKYGKDKDVDSANPESDKLSEVAKSVVNNFNELFPLVNSTSKVLLSSEIKPLSILSDLDLDSKYTIPNEAYSDLEVNDMNAADLELVNAFPRVKQNIVKAQLENFKLGVSTGAEFLAQLNEAANAPFVNNLQGASKSLRDTLELVNRLQAIQSTEFITGFPGKEQDDAYAVGVLNNMVAQHTLEGEMKPYLIVTSKIESKLPKLKTIELGLPDTISSDNLLPSQKDDIAKALAMGLNDYAYEVAGTTVIDSIIHVDPKSEKNEDLLLEAFTVRDFYTSYIDSMYEEEDSISTEELMSEIPNFKLLRDLFINGEIYSLEDGDFNEHTTQVLSTLDFSKAIKLSSTADNQFDSTNRFVTYGNINNRLQNGRVTNSSIITLEKLDLVLQNITQHKKAITRVLLNDFFRSYVHTRGLSLDVNSIYDLLDSDSVNDKELALELLSADNDALIPDDFKEIGARPRIVADAQSVKEIDTAKTNINLLFRDNVQVRVGVNALLDTSKTEGVTAGFFVGNIINLHDPKYAGHEAFHFVFRSLLTGEQASHYLAKIKSELNLSPAELAARVSELRKTSSNFESLSDKRLEDLVHEEALADMYQDFYEENEIPTNWLVALFNLIKNAFKSISGNRTHIEALFHKINNRGFAFTRPKSNKFTMDVPVYKMLKQGDVYDAEENIIDDPAPESKASQVYYEVAALLHEAILENPDVRRMPEHYIKRIMSERSAYYDHTDGKYDELLDALSDEEYEKNDREFNRNRILYNPDTISLDGMTNGDIVINAVRDLFKIFGVNYLSEHDSETLLEIEASAEANNVGDNREFTDMSPWELSTLELVDQELRIYIGLTLYDKVDELTGEIIKAPIDSNAVFSGLAIALASKELDTQSFYPLQDPLFALLDAYTKGNPQAAAFYDKLRRDTNNDKEHNLIQLVKKSFNNVYLDFTELVFDPNTGYAQFMSSANQNAVTIQRQDWLKSWEDLELTELYANEETREGMLESFDYLRDILDPANDLDVILYLDGNPKKDGIDYLDIFINGADTKDGRIHSFEELTGIKISKNYLRYSIISQYSEIAKRNPTDYKQLEDLVGTAISLEEYTLFLEMESNEDLPFLSVINMFELRRVLATDYNPGLAKRFQEVTGVDDYRNIHIDFDKVRETSERTSNLISEGGVTSILNNIATGNLPFDESLQAVSSQDALGRARHNLTQKSYEHTLLTRMRMPLYREHILKKYPFLKRNLLMGGNPYLPIEASNAVFGKSFKPVLIGDVAQRPISSPVLTNNARTNDPDARKSKTPNKEGVTSKTVDFGSYMILNLALFSKRRDVQFKHAKSNTHKDIPTAFFSPKVTETKATDLASPLPIGGVDRETGIHVSYSTQDGDFSPEGLEVAYKLVINEMQMVIDGDAAIVKGVEDYIKFFNNRPSAKELHDLHIEAIGIKKELRVGDPTGRNTEALEARLETIQSILDLKPDTVLHEGLQIKTKDGTIKPEFYTENDKEVIAKTKLVGDFKGYGLGRTTEFWNFKHFIEKSKGLQKMVATRRRLLNLTLRELLDTLTPSEVIEKAKLESNKKLLQTLPHDELRELHKNFLTEERDGLLKQLDFYSIIKLGKNNVITNIKLPAPPLHVVYDHAQDMDVTENLYYTGDKATAHNPNYLWFITDFFINHYINSSSINEIIDKDPRTVKNPVERTKRNTGKPSSGAGAGKGTSKFGIMAEPLVYTKSGVEVEAADGQASLSFEGFEFLLKRWGRYPDTIQKTMEDIRFGLDENTIKWEDIETITNLNTALNAIKTVTYDGEIYHKLSYQVLSYNYTSVLPARNREEAKNLKTQILEIEKNIKEAIKAEDPQELIDSLNDELKDLWLEYEVLWMPHPYHTELHNIRRNMMFNGLMGVLPPTASKMKTPIAAKPDADGHFDFSYSSQEVENENWRLQVELPSGKSNIRYFSQVLNLIDNEIDLSIVYPVRGKDMTMGEIKEEYHKVLGERLEQAVNGALLEIGSLDESGYLSEVDFEKFRPKIYKSLQDSGADDSVLAYFRDSKYNGNLPAIVNKYQQLFLAHFTKGVLHASVSGRKVTMTSGYGNQVVVNKSTGKIVDRNLISADPDLFIQPNGKLKPGLLRRRLKWSTGYATNSTIKMGDKELTVPFDKAKVLGLLLREVNPDPNDINSPLTMEVTEEAKELGFNSVEAVEALTDDILAMVHGRLIDNEINSRLKEENQFKITDLDNINSKNYKHYLKAIKQRIGDEAYDTAVEWFFGTEAKPTNTSNARRFIKSVLHNSIITGTPQHQSVAEVLMPAWDRFTHGISQGDTIDRNHPAWISIMEQFATRIPTQDKHSMMVFKVVGFLPSYMGDIAVLPDETIWLSGEDFDADAKYIHRKAYYTSIKNGKVHINVHGEADESITKQDERDFEEAIYNRNSMLNMGDMPVTYEDGDAVKYAEWKNFLVDTRKRNRSVKFDTNRLMAESDAYQELLTELKNLIAISGGQKNENAEFIKQIVELEAKLSESNIDLEAKELTIAEYTKLEQLTEASDTLLDIEWEINAIEAHELFATVLDIKQRLKNLRQNGISSAMLRLESMDTKIDLDTQMSDNSVKVDTSISNSEAYEVQMLELDELFDVDPTIDVVSEDSDLEREIFRLEREEEYLRVSELVDEYYDLQGQLNTALSIIADELNAREDRPSLFSITYDSSESLEKNYWVLLNTLESIAKLESPIEVGTSNEESIEALEELVLNKLEEVENTYTGAKELVTEHENVIDQILLRDAPSDTVRLIAFHKKRLKLAKERFRRKALKMNRLPSTFEEFKASNYRSTAVLDNLLLEFNKAFYLNSGNVEITLTPSSMTKFHGDDTFTGLRDVLNHLSGEDAGTYHYNTFRGQMIARISNILGKELIGPAAVANIIKAALAKAGVNLTQREYQDTVTINIDGEDYTTFTTYYSEDIQFEVTTSPNGTVKSANLSYSKDSKLTTKQYRIMDELSTILSAMTDNSKHNDAAHVGFTIHTLGTYLYMVALGMGINRMGLLSKSPAMSQYNKEMASREGAIISQWEEERNKEKPRLIILKQYAKLREAIRHKLNTRLAELNTEYDSHVQIGKSLFSIAEIENAELRILSSELRSDELMFAIELKRDTGKRFGVDFADEAFIEVLENDETITYTELATYFHVLGLQMQAINAFDRLSRQSRHFSNVNAILKVHQGLPPSFHEQLKTHAALESFGIDLNKLAAGEVNYLVDSYNESHSSYLPFEITDLLDSAPDLIKGLQALHKIDKAAQHLFISETDAVRETFRYVMETLGHGLQNRDNVLRGVKGQIMGFITMNAIRTIEGPDFKFDTDLLNSHSDNTIYDRLRNLMAIAKQNGNTALSKNLLIRALNRTQDRVVTNGLNDLISTANAMEELVEVLQFNIDELTANTRSSAPADYNNRIIDAYRELMYGNIVDIEIGDGTIVTNEEGVSVVSAFAEDLFQYLVVRDGLQFRNGTYSKFIAPEKYLKLSETLDNLLLAFKEDNWTGATLSNGKVPESIPLELQLGMTKDEFKDNFITLYGLNPTNKDNFKTMNLVTLDGFDSYNSIYSAERELNVELKLDLDNRISLVKAYNKNGNQLGMSTSLPHFIEFDISNIFGIMDKHFKTVVGKLHRAYKDKAVAEVPGLQYFDPSGEEYGFKMFKSAFSSFNEYRAAVQKARTAIQNGHMLTEGLHHVNGYTAHIAEKLSRASGGAIGHVGSNLAFPKFIKIDSTYEDSDPANPDMFAEEVYSTSLYMLTNTIEKATDKNGNPIPNKTNLIESQKGVYVKVDPIYTPAYSYLYTASEFKDDLLDDVANKAAHTEKELEKKKNKLHIGYAKEVFKKLTSRVYDQTFDIKYREGPYDIHQITNIPKDLSPVEIKAVAARLPISQNLSSETVVYLTDETGAKLIDGDGYLVAETMGSKYRADAPHKRIDRGSALARIISGVRTQIIVSPTQLKTIQQIAARQGTFNSLGGVVINLADTNPLSETYGKSVYVRLSENSMSDPTRESFAANSGWNDAIWDHVKHKYKLGTKGSWKALSFEFMEVSDMPVANTVLTEIHQPITDFTMADIIGTSGGAYGGDTFFHQIGLEHGLAKGSVLHYSFKERPGVSKSLHALGIRATILTDDEMSHAFDRFVELTGYNGVEEDFISKLKSRNYYQIAEADGVFAVAEITGNLTRVKGGTNAAVEMASALHPGIPIYIFDPVASRWFKKTGSVFSPVTPPILTKRPALIGSRDIELYEMYDRDTKTSYLSPKYKGVKVEEAAREAITKLFTDTKAAMAQGVKLLNAEKSGDLDNKIKSSKSFLAHDDIYIQRVNDSVSHINMDKSGRTALGKLLTHSATTPFTLGDTEFQSMNSWKLWTKMNIVNEQSDTPIFTTGDLRSIATSDSATAIQRIRTILNELSEAGFEIESDIQIPKAALIEALTAKAIQNPRIIQGLQSLTMPLTAYAGISSDPSVSRFTLTPNTDAEELALWGRIKDGILSSPELKVKVDKAQVKRDLANEELVVKASDASKAEEAAKAEKATGKKKKTPTKKSTKEKTEDSDSASLVSAAAIAKKSTSKKPTRNKVTKKEANKKIFEAMAKVINTMTHTYYDLVEDIKAQISLSDEFKNGDNSMVVNILNDILNDFSRNEFIDWSQFSKLDVALLGMPMYNVSTVSDFAKKYEISMPLVVSILEEIEERFQLGHSITAVLIEALADAKGIDADLTVAQIIKIKEEQGLEYNMFESDPLSELPKHIDTSGYIAAMKANDNAATIEIYSPLHDKIYDKLVRRQNITIRKWSELGKAKSIFEYEMVMPPPPKSTRFEYFNSADKSLKYGAGVSVGNKVFIYIGSEKNETTGIEEVVLLDFSDTKQLFRFPAAEEISVIGQFTLVKNKDKSFSIVTNKEEVFTAQGEEVKLTPSKRKAYMIRAQKAAAAYEADYLASLAPNEGVKTLKRMISTRVKGSNEHFGNPFTSNKKLLFSGSKLIEAASTADSVKAYIEWITYDGTNPQYVSEEVQKALSNPEYEAQRQFMLRGLKSQKLLGVKLVYWATLKEASHADALRYLIDFHYNDSISGAKKLKATIPGQTKADEIIEEGVEIESTKSGLSAPFPGVVHLKDSGLTVQQANEFIDILAPIIKTQAATENTGANANLMFSLGSRWTRIRAVGGHWKAEFDKLTANPDFIKEVNEVDSEKNPQKLYTGWLNLLNKWVKTDFATEIIPYNQGWSASGFNYGYSFKDAFGNTLLEISTIEPITKFVEQSLGIDLSEYDAVLGNIYTPTTFLPPHRDTSEHKDNGKYAIVVLSIGADGSISKAPSDYYKGGSDKSRKRWETLPLSNGGIYAFGVGGIDRFSFFHAVDQAQFGKTTPTKPIELPDGTILDNYRITLTYRKALPANANVSIKSTKESKSTKEVKETNKPKKSTIQIDNPNLTPNGTNDLKEDFSTEDNLNPLTMINSYDFSPHAQLEENEVYVYTPNSLDEDDPSASEDIALGLDESVRRWGRISKPESGITEGEEGAAYPIAYTDDLKNLTHFDRFFKTALENPDKVFRVNADSANSGLSQDEMILQFLKARPIDGFPKNVRFPKSYVATLEKAMKIQDSKEETDSKNDCKGK